MMIFGCKKNRLRHLPDVWKHVVSWHNADFGYKMDPRTLEFCNEFEKQHGKPRLWQFSSCACPRFPTDKSDKIRPRKMCGWENERCPVKPPRIMYDIVFFVHVLWRMRGNQANDCKKYPAMGVVQDCVVVC